MQRDADIDCAIVIVTWNIEKLIADAIDSVQQDASSSGMRHRVVVVDNGSTDATVANIREHTRDVTVLEPGENNGFGWANNLGLRYLGFGSDMPADELPATVLLLNPDTRTHTGAMAAMQRALRSDDSIGMVGPALQYGDGSFQEGAFQFPGLQQAAFDLYPVPDRLRITRLNGRYPQRRYQKDAPFTVDFVLGAAMLLRREAILACWKNEGLFDPAYFMYMEEVDLARRLSTEGWHVMVAPDAIVTHYAGASSASVPLKTQQRLWHSRLTYASRHYSPLRYRLFRRIVLHGLQLRRWSATRRHQPQVAQIANEMVVFVKSWQPIPAQQP